jgi:LPS-assembly lipoprotein
MGTQLPGAKRTSRLLNGARLACLLIAALALDACGFHLQGRTPLPAALATTRVIADDDQTDFVQGLRRALIFSGSKLTEQSERATGVVHIHKDEVTQKIISVSVKNIPREYEVTYTVEFSVEGVSGELLPSQKVSITRDYSFDETKLLAKENEEAILREGMARDLVAIVMRRLSAI